MAKSRQMGISDILRLPPGATLGYPREESDEQHLVRLKGRANRIQRKLAKWSRAELEVRYAWMLLLALEQHKAMRASRLLGEVQDAFLLLRSMQYIARGQVAKEMQLKLIQHRRDRQRGPVERLKKNPKANAKAGAMDAIHSEYDRWQASGGRYESQEDFKRKMHMQHPQVTEGSIGNAIRRWRTKHSSR